MFSWGFVRICHTAYIYLNLSELFNLALLLYHFNTHPEYANEFEIATAPDFNVTTIFLFSLRLPPVLCTLSTSAGENITVSSSSPPVQVAPGETFTGIICQ